MSLKAYTEISLSIVIKQLSISILVYSLITFPGQSPLFFNGNFNALIWCWEKWWNEMMLLCLPIFFCIAIFDKNPFQTEERNCKIVFFLGNAFIFSCLLKIRWNFKCLMWPKAFQYHIQHAKHFGQLFNFTIWKWN